MNTYTRGTRLRVATMLLAICGAWTAEAAEETLRVALATAPLADPNMVLSASSFDRQKPQRPIVYYSAYGSEVLLPNRRMVFSAQNPQQALSIGGVAGILRQGPEGFRLVVEGKSAALKFSGLGCAPAPMATAAIGSVFISAAMPSSSDTMCRISGMREGPPMKTMRSTSSWL